MDLTATQSATPMQQALGQQQQPQQPQTPGIVDLLNQRIQQGDQILDQEKAQAAAQSPATVSRALGMVTPSSTRSVPAQIGKSIATSNYAGYCLKFVDDVQGNTQRQPTAYADYQANAQSGNISTKGTPPKGARTYFAPDESNGGAGHVGISNGDGTFTSATDNGIKTYKLSDWEKSTGQQFIGYSTKNK